MRWSLAAWIASALLPLPSLPGQGPVYREHWGFAHLEDRRRELLGELCGRPAEAVAMVAAELARDDEGLPFRPVAVALARLRGVEPDEAFVCAATIGAYVLPEVVDPTAEHPNCRGLNVSVCLPFSVPMPGALAFDLAVFRADGEIVWTERIDNDVELADLRAGRARASMACDELSDGVYRLVMHTVIDGARPRATDPVVQRSFRVLRGYQRRSEAAMQAAKQRRDHLPPAPRALLDGLAMRVLRAYAGEPFVPNSDAVDDLHRLERALANVASGTDVLAGFAGDVATALPIAAGVVLPAVLRLGPAEARAAPQPLVVFATGAPAYDLTARRPLAPAGRDAGWALGELAGFAAGRPWRVALLDSPSANISYAQVLRTALPLLAELLPTGGGLPLLVCDREAAAIAALSAQELLPLVSGLVLVGAAAMPRGALEAPSPAPIRAVRLHGQPGSQNLQNALDFVARRSAAGLPCPDLALLVEPGLPWLYGVPLAAGAIETFAAACFAAR